MQWIALYRGNLRDIDQPFGGVHRHPGDHRQSFFIAVALRSAEFLGESDKKPFRPADVAEPIRVFILDYFAYELRAALAEPFKRLVDVVHGEHDAEVA